MTGTRQAAAQHAQILTQGEEFVSSATSGMQAYEDRAQLAVNRFIALDTESSVSMAQIAHAANDVVGGMTRDTQTGQARPRDWR